MTRKDEPNGDGYAGDPTAAAAAPRDRDVATEEAEEEAEPGSDHSREFREALADSDLDEEVGPGRPGF
jgi:hypothetical protein